MPNTNEMSIKPVHAARITDTTGALVGESHVRRHHAQSCALMLVNKKMTQKSVDRIRAEVRPRSNKRVGGRGGERT